jgi:hypothetical protein
MTGDPHGSPTEDLAVTMLHACLFPATSWDSQGLSKRFFCPKTSRVSWQMKVRWRIPIPSDALVVAPIFTQDCTGNYFCWGSFILVPLFKANLFPAALWPSLGHATWKKNEETSGNLQKNRIPSNSHEFRSKLLCQCRPTDPSCWCLSFSTVSSVT